MKNKILLMSILSFLSFLNPLKAQDWPSLERYREANAELQAPKPGENRVVFMGNSITAGWSKARAEFFEGKPYINRGISGQTTPQMVLRFRQDVINLQPKVVVILAGINDIAGNTGPSTIEMIFGNIVSMVELAQANNIKVVLCSVLPAADFPWRKGMEPADKVIELNNQIKAYAKAQKIPYVDYYSPMVNENKGLKDELGHDGIHPNVEGYKIMESELEKVLKKVLK